MDPTISDIIKVHGHERTRMNWRMPLDAVDAHLPSDFKQSFARGYTEGDAWLMHRAFKQWSDGLGLNPPTPDFRLFSLPGYDGIDVKSIDDLDPDDAKRVALVKSAAALWHRDVCLARVTLRYYGPLPFSPGNGFGDGLGHDVKHQTVLQCLAEFKPEADVELGLARLSDTAGTTILPEAAGLGSELRLVSKFSPCHFIQDDFFGAVPDQEETVRPPGPSHHAWVRQTWTRNAVLLIQMHHSWDFLQESIRESAFGDHAISSVVHHILGLGLQSYFLFPHVLDAVNELYRTIHKCSRPLLMTGPLKSRILQFALTQEKPDLFARACNCENDAPPGLAFFSWAREYCVKRPSLVQHPAIYSGLRRVVVSYDKMYMRLEAAKRLNTETPKALPVALPCHWLLDLITPDDPNANFKFCQTFKDGHAQAEIVAAASFHSPNLHTRFLDSILAYVWGDLSPPFYVDPQLWIPGFITGSVKGMKHTPQHINTNHLADLCRVFAEEDRFCAAISCWEDEHGITTSTITPGQLNQFLTALNKTFPGAHTLCLKQMQLAVSAIRGTAELQHFWLPWIHSLSKTPRPLETANLNNFITALLYSYAVRHLGPPPPPQPDDLAWPVTLHEHMSEFWAFLADSTQQEARFGWNSLQREAIWTVREIPGLETSLDPSTKPPTTVLRKRSRADPEQHAAWGKRKEEVRGEFGKFDQEFLRRVTGEFYERLVEFPELEGPDCPLPRGTTAFGVQEQGQAEVGRGTEEILGKIATAQALLAWKESAIVDQSMAGPSQAARLRTPQSSLSGTEEVDGSVGSPSNRAGGSQRGVKRRASTVDP